MRMQYKQFKPHQWLVNNEPLVVLGNCKKRDGPVIYHRRDGPLFNTGPSGGKGPPDENRLHHAVGFPKETGPPRTGVG